MTTLPQESIDLIKYWIEERHRIYLKRKSGESYPWTKDKILSEKRFCNVFRELDKETAWIRDKWLKPLEEKNSDKLWFAPFVFRVFNLGNSFDKFGNDHGLSPVENFEKTKPLLIGHLKELSKSGPIFSSAYMISTFGNVAKHKYEFFINDVLQRILNHEYEIKSILETNYSFEMVFKKIKGLRLNSFSGFILYQVILDLTYTKYLRKHSDRYHWTLIGDGAIKGLNVFFGRDVKTRISQDQALEETRVMMNTVNSVVDKSLFKETFKELGYCEKFDIHTIEFISCEVRKYAIQKSGKGRMKNYIRN